MTIQKRPETAQTAPVSKEHARLRLYLLGLVLDMWGMLASFVLANWLVLGSPWGEPEKPHGIVIFAVMGPIYALLAINGGAYGIRMLGAARTSAAHALLAFVQAAMLTLFIIFFAKIGEQISRLTFLVGGLLSLFALVACRYVMTGLSRRILGAVPRVELFIADGVELPHLPGHMSVIDARKQGIDPTRHDAKMAEKLARAVGGAEH
ncbi:MAG: sugar transferase, partial [Sphingomonadaceae bacterium]|nr:sugar transferase [Sphingomonadaceae bacterium]